MIGQFRNTTQQHKLWRLDAKWLGIVLLLGLFGLLVAGCEPTPTPGPSPTPSLSPTSGPSPTPSPSPTPTPAVGPFEPKGVPDPRLGMTWINTCYIEEAAHIPDDNEELARSAGATWDRWPFEWGRIMASGSPIFDNPDWAINYSTPVARDDNNGLETLAIINYGTNSTVNPDGSYNDVKWREYVTTIVENYGNQIDAWELGNEAGLPQNKNITDDDFILALEAACTILRDNGQYTKPILLESPESPALLGIANIQGERGTTDDLEYVEEWAYRLDKVVEKELLRGCIDAISLHVYGRSDDSYWVTAKVHAYLGGLNEDWNPGVWLTETGAQETPCDLIYDAACFGAPDNTDDGGFLKASYVIQQYVLALKGFDEAGLDETNPDQAMIFHHRFAETIWTDDSDVPDWFEHEKYWNLVSLDRGAVNYSYKAISLVSALFGGASYIGDESAEYSFGDAPYSPPTYRHLLFSNPQGNIIHVLWAGGTSVQEALVKPRQEREATLYFQTGGTSPDAWEFHRQEHFMAGPDGFRLELPGTTAPDRSGPNNAFHGWPQVGGRTYLLIESREESRAPEGKACLICENGRVIGTDFIVYDEHSGLDTGAAQFSPQRSWDLSETEPGVQYAYTSDEYPPGRWRRYLYPHQQGRSLHHPNPLPPTGLLQERWRRQSRRRPS